MNEIFGSIAMIKFILPAYWVRYLLHKDLASLSDGERGKADAFLAKHKLHGVLVTTDNKPGFAKHDADHGPACNVLNYSFILNAATIPDIKPL